MRTSTSQPPALEQGWENQAKDREATVHAKMWSLESSIDCRANCMADQDVHFLNPRGARRGNRKTNVRDIFRLAAIAARQTDCSQTPFARDLEGSENIQRISGRRNSYERVPCSAKRRDLTREHLLDAKVVGRSGERRRVGCKRDRRKSNPVLFKANGKFGRNMLAVSCATAIAADQHLIAAFKRFADLDGNCLDQRSQRSQPVGDLDVFCKDALDTGSRGFDSWP
jgi:hypothetical protein